MEGIAGSNSQSGLAYPSGKPLIQCNAKAQIADGKL
jgi:hypothetical protein